MKTWPQLKHLLMKEFSDTLHTNGTKIAQSSHQMFRVIFTRDQNRNAMRTTDMAYSIHVTERI